MYYFNNDTLMLQLIEFEANATDIEFKGNAKDVISLQEIMSSKKQIEELKSKIEKAVELLKRYTDNESNYYVPVFELIDILNGRSDE